MLFRSRGPAGQPTPACPAPSPGRCRPTPPPPPPSSTTRRARALRPAPAAAPATGIDAVLAQRIKDASAPKPATAAAEPSLTADTLEMLRAQNEYLKNAPLSPAVKAQREALSRSAERAKQADAEEAAQRRSNTFDEFSQFLMNMRGSSLAAGAGNASAAVAPLREANKKARAEYARFKSERDDKLDKARFEMDLAEEARQRGEFSKAMEHAEKARTYRLDAQKAKDQAEHYKNVEFNQLLGTAATRESSREGHLTQLEVAKINRSATLAAHPDYVAEYQKRIKEQGQKAADDWLDSVGKVLGVTKNFDSKAESLKVQRDKAVTTALKDFTPYTDAIAQIARLEKLQRKGKLTPKEQTALDNARIDAQKYYNDVYKRLHGEDAPAPGETSAPPKLSKEEYDRAPSGTRFTAPDGSIRTKP